MAFTAAQIQADIAAALLPADPGGLVAGDIAFYWSLYADKASVAPRLQELYTYRRCVDLLLAYYANQVDVAVGEDVAVKQSQISGQLNERRSQVEGEIRIIESRARANRVPALALLTTTAPTAPPTVAPIPTPTAADGNDPRYGGSVYLPLPGRW